MVKSNTKTGGDATVKTLAATLQAHIGDFSLIVFIERVNRRGRARQAWIDRRNDGLSRVPADGISLPLMKGTSARPALGRLED